VAESLAPLYDTDATSVRSSPLTLIGSREEISQMLYERRERWGYSYLVLPAGQAREFAPLVEALTGT
jgi:hypothetical protein